VNKAFVDSTILTDALLKVGDRKQNALNALKKYAITELPYYAIKEFRAGPLHGYVWFYNKLIITNSFTQSIAELHRLSLSGQKNLTSSALEAFSNIMFLKGSIPLQKLVEKYGEKASEDEMLLAQTRLALKSLILNAWKRRKEITTVVVNELTCFSDIGPLTLNKRLEIKPLGCKTDDCCLAQEYRKNLNNLKTLKNVVESQEHKAENMRRVNALNKMIQSPKNKISDNMCRAFGDIYYAIFSPVDSIILTTNINDHQPLAEALNKKAETP
jgi:hypothetical protein